MICKFCGHPDTVKAGTTSRAKPTPRILQQYKCKKCFRIFPIEVEEVVGNKPDPSPLPSAIQSTSTKPATIPSCAEPPSDNANQSNT